MPYEISNPRRSPRSTVRCVVEIRHRLAAWMGETEDLGPRGCQIVTDRLVEPGRSVRLAIRVEAIDGTIDGRGRVVWIRPLEPSRMGVSFRARGGDGWFEALARADPAGFSRHRAPDRLPRRARLFLGRPPRHVVDFSPVEREILRRIDAGTTLDALDRSFGEGLDAAARGALFSLLARGIVVLDPAASGEAGAWRSLLPRGEKPPLPSIPERPTPRSPEVQRLYEEGLTHLGAGHVALAVDRFEAALGIDPRDEAISRTIQRLSRWT